MFKSFKSWIVSIGGKKLIRLIIIPALTPNRCRNSQLYFSLRQRISFQHPSLHLLPALPHAHQGTQSGTQVWETSKGDKWETNVNSCGPTQSGRQVWETRVGNKCGRQV